MYKICFNVIGTSEKTRLTSQRKRYACYYKMYPLSAYVTHDCSMMYYCVVCSDEAIEKAHDELTRVRDEVEAWQVTNEATQVKLQREKDHVRGYKVSNNHSITCTAFLRLQLRIQMYESERENAEKAVIEAAELRKQLETHQK